MEQETRSGRRVVSLFPSVASGAVGTTTSTPTSVDTPHSSRASTKRTTATRKVTTWKLRAQKPPKLPNSINVCIILALCILSAVLLFLLHRQRDRLRSLYFIQESQLGIFTNGTLSTSLYLPTQVFGVLSRDLSNHIYIYAYLFFLLRAADESFINSKTTTG